MDTCYKYFDKEFSWLEACDHCSKFQNSSLLIVNNKQKLASYQKFIKMEVENGQDEPKFYKKWVKGTKIQPSKFTWVTDGTEVDLSFSLHGLTRQLNNSGEYCGGFDASVENRLNDMFCSNKADFICEFKCIHKGIDFSSIVDKWTGQLR